MGPWEISSGVLQDFYVLVALLGVGLLVALNWEWIRHRIGARQRAREAQVLADKEARKRAIVLALEASRPIANGLGCDVPTFFYMQDKLAALEIAFVDMEDFDNPYAFDGLSLIRRYLKEGDVEKARKIGLKTRTLIADAKQQRQ